MLALLTALVAEGAEKEETINPVLPVSHELFWGAVAFFGLLIVMWAVCLPPIKKAMRQRDEQEFFDQRSLECCSGAQDEVSAIVERHNFDTWRQA